MKRQLTLACGAYDRTMPLIDGRVIPEGLELNWIVLSPHEIWTRMLNHYEFDASEMSLSSYLISRTMKKPLIAIPIFPARAFRHSFIFVNSKSGIKEPKDLNGRRVAHPEFQQTAAVMARGILQNEYGVDLESIHWYNWYQPRTEVKMYKSYKMYSVPTQRAAEEMLDRGEVDAMIGARIPELFTKGSSNIKRIFANPKEEEIRYFKKTKVFPIMHTLVIREPLWKEEPWIAPSLYKAFLKAKEMAYNAISPTRPFNLSLAWTDNPIEEQKAILGDDPWAYGAANNQHIIEILAKYLLQQGLLPEPLNTKDVFAPNTTTL